MAPGVDDGTAFSCSLSWFLGFSVSVIGLLTTLLVGRPALAMLSAPFSPATMGEKDLAGWNSTYHDVWETRLSGFDTSEVWCNGEFPVNLQCYYKGVHLVLSSVGTACNDTTHTPFIQNALEANTDSTFQVCGWQAGRFNLQTGPAAAKEVDESFYELCRAEGALIFQASSGTFSQSFILSDTTGVPPNIGLAADPIQALTEGLTAVINSGQGGDEFQDCTVNTQSWISHSSCRADFGGVADPATVAGVTFCEFGAGGDAGKVSCYVKDIDDVTAFSFDFVVDEPSDAPSRLSKLLPAAYDPFFGNFVSMDVASTGAGGTNQLWLAETSVGTFRRTSGLGTNSPPAASTLAGTEPTLSVGGEGSIVRLVEPDGIVWLTSNGSVWKAEWTGSAIQNEVLVTDGGAARPGHGGGLAVASLTRSVYWIGADNATIHAGSFTSLETVTDVVLDAGVNSDMEAPLVYLDESEGRLWWATAGQSGIYSCVTPATTSIDSGASIFVTFEALANEPSVFRLTEGGTRLFYIHADSDTLSLAPVQSSSNFAIAETNVYTGEGAMNALAVSPAPDRFVFIADSTLGYVKRARYGECGDGFLDTLLGEACDDGNLISNDGCSSSCVVDVLIPRCGDGIVSTESEECDEGDDDVDGNSDTESDKCRTNCLLPFCGDGVVDTGAGEECDPLGDAIRCSDECFFTERPTPSNSLLGLLLGTGAVALLVAGVCMLSTASAFFDPAAEEEGMPINM